MIDAKFFRRFYICASALCALMAVGSFLIWRSTHVTGGVLAGFALGIFPFVTWQLIGKLLVMQNGRAAAVGLTVMKFAILGGALYLLLTRGWVNPWALMAGMIAVSLVFFVVSLVRLAVLPTEGVA